MNPKAFGAFRIINTCLFIVSTLVLYTSLPAQNTASATENTFRAESFTLGYGIPEENIIPLDALRDIKVNIELRDGVYHAAPALTKKSPPPVFTVGQAYPGGKFSESALVEIFQSISKYYNKRGLFGVFVVVNRDDIDPQTHEDYRPADRKDLRLAIWVSRVSEIRSIGKGTRFPPAESINAPAHSAIVKHSPLQAAGGANSSSALWKARLDDYLLDLNRHPARRVDASIAAGTTPGEVTLDYLVSETRPWFAYAQIANSGTEETDKLRAHLGFSYYQLTNYDDTLLVDLSASPKVENGFSASASYNRPLLYPNTLRAKVFAAYTEFTSRDLGLALDKFTGYSVATGVEFPWSPFRLWGFSFDFVPGVTWQQNHTYDSNLAGTALYDNRRNTDFIAASFDIRLQRNTDTMRTYLGIGYETNFDGDTSLSPDQLIALGRAQIVRDYQILKVDFSHSMYIEPLLFGEKFYTGDSWRKSARAHEISLTSRGQYVLNNERILAQKQMTLGGMYSVRGYPESVVAADNVYVASFEYRLHVPRLFRPYSALARDRGDRAAPTYFGIPVNWRSPNLHAVPDWDFIVRLFGDIGRAQIIDVLPWESSHTLASVGIGCEAQLKGIFNARIDWGFAQKPVKTNVRDVSRNSSQVHFTISLLW